MGVNSIALERTPRIKASVSLRVDQVQAAKQIASEERHNNVSLIFQRLIDAGLEVHEAERKSTTSDLESSVAA